MTRASILLLLCAGWIIPAGARAQRRLPPGAPCHSGDQCRTRICEGQGCGPRSGQCANFRRPCTRDLAAFCGCDGRTFRASSSCPGRLYRHRGACRVQPRPEASVVFRDLRISAPRGGGVRLHYAIRRSSWRWLREQGITPTLHVQIAGREQGRVLRSREGSLSFNRRRPINRVQIRMSGTNGKEQLRWMDLNGIQAYAVTLRAPNTPPPPLHGPPHHPPSPPPPPPPRPQTNWAGNPGVIRACGDAFNGQRNEASCLDSAARAAFNPVALIRVCADAMGGDSNELECLRLGVRVPRDPSTLVSACADAMDGDRNELECLGHVAPHARFFLVNAIKACADLMTGDRQEMACISAASRARRNPTPTIRACASFSGQKSKLQCVQRGVR